MSKTSRKNKAAAQAAALAQAEKAEAERTARLADAAAKRAAARKLALPALVELDLGDGEIVVTDTRTGAQHTRPDFLVPAGARAETEARKAAAALLADPTRHLDGGRWVTGRLGGSASVANEGAAAPQSSGGTAESAKAAITAVAQAGRARAEALSAAAILRDQPDRPGLARYYAAREQARTLSGEEAFDLAVALLSDLAFEADATEARLARTLAHLNLGA